VSVIVTVAGQSGSSVVATNGDTVAVTVSPAGAQGPQGQQGSAGPANTLSIGTVTSGTAAATITGTAPNQTLNLVLPVGSTGATGSKGDIGSQGPAGPANTLSIGTVTSGTAAATITGTAPNQTLNLVLQPGATGATGATGPQGPSGTVNLADETPQPLGTASAGTALSAARADHVHAQGAIAYSGLTGIPSSFAPSAHSHAVSDVSGLQAALDAKQASGTYATLVSGTVPSSQLPSYVDDVIEYANLAAFTEQSTGKIYVARDTGKIYRWSGSAYVEISPSPGSTDSVTEGSTNLYFTNARAAAAAPVQSVAGRSGTVTLTKSDVGLGNVSNTDATARANHTGTQLALTISDFATEAAKYGPVASVAGRTGTITLTKSDVGLGSVDNTADASKPVSTAQAAADTAVQSFAIQRANHTGTQAISTVSGLQSALDGKQPSGSYASSSHTHSLSDISQSSATTGQVPTWNGSAWAAATPSGGGGGSGSIVTAASVSAFPATGSASNLYITTEDQRIWRWDATASIYVESGPSGGSGLSWSSVPTSATATGSVGQVAYDSQYQYTCVSSNFWRRVPYAVWSPTLLTGLQCWLDASDHTTLFNAGSGGNVPDDGGSIGRWLDKAGSNHATDAVDGSNATISTQRPTRVARAQNGLDAINFGGTQWFDQNSARDMLRNRSCAIMAVAMKYGTVNNSLNQFAWANRKGTATSDVGLRYQLMHRSDNTLASVSRRLDADAVNLIASTSTVPPFDTSWHVHVALCDWTNGTLYYRIDGSQVGTASYASSGNTSDTSLGTAANTSDSASWTAIGASGRTLRTDGVANNLALSSGSQIGEMICHARTSGSYVTADLQTVEAYLAWRWGLQANLPAGHPYKSVPPSF